MTPPLVIRGLQSHQKKHYIHNLNKKQMAIPWVAIGATIASIAGQIISSNAQRKAQRRGTKRYNEAQKQIASQARAEDLAQWNRENEYSNPTSQMKRLRQAGLNPNLIYGSSTPTGASAHLGQYQAPQIDKNIDPVVPGDTIAGGISSYNNVKVQQAQTDNVKQLTKNAQTQNIGVAMDNVMKAKKIPKAQRWADKQLEKLEHEVDTEFQSAIQKGQGTSNMVQQRNLLIEQIGETKARKALTQANLAWQQAKNKLSGVMTKDQFIIQIIQRLLNK